MVTISDNDRSRLKDTGILSCWRSCPRKLAEHDPSLDDLKRYILIEAERGLIRENILKKLVVRMQQKEREALYERINKLRKGRKQDE